MATRDVMKITGLDAFLSGLREAPAYVQAKASQAVAVSTSATERAVEGGAPVDTGTLRGAIHSKAAALTGQVLIGPEAYYWRFIEYGTSRGTSLGGRISTLGARPFIRQAAEQEAPKFLRLMEGVATGATQLVSTGRSDTQVTSIGRFI
jgi:HK97 gp10 family phage protein